MQGAQKTGTLEPFTPVRRASRFVPAQSVTIAVLNHGFPSGYGVVTNISENGACVQAGEIWTQRGIHVMLSFSDGDMLEARGRIVWSQPLDAAGIQGLFGIEFTELADRHRKTIRNLLDSQAFTAA